MISVLRNNTPTASHFKLKVTKENDRTLYEVQGSEKPFEKINKLLEYFKINSIPPTVMTLGNSCDDKQRPVETTV